MIEEYLNPIFKAEDGRVFSTRAAAEDHEEYLKRPKIYLIYKGIRYSHDYNKTLIYASLSKIYAEEKLQNLEKRDEDRFYMYDIYEFPLS